MRRGVRLEYECEDFSGTACSVLSSLAVDCGVNISLVDPMVLASNTNNLLVKWGVGVTIDQPENPLQPFPTLWPAWPCQPSWHSWVHPLHPSWLQPLQLLNF